MVILGIDPGLRMTGFGLIRKTGQKLQYISSGVIKTPDADLPARLQVIVQGVADIVATYQPVVAGVEKVFVNVNPQSTLLLGHARGAAIAALVQHHVAVHEYTALQVKQAVVGQGKAKKEQVQAMVVRLLHLPGTPAADAADALACAICHAHAADATAQIGIAAQNFGGEMLGKRGYRVRRGRLVM